MLHCMIQCQMDNSRSMELRKNMENDLQKASIWKRISAAIFDGMLIALVAVGVAFLLSLAFDFDGQYEKLNAAYAKYEAQYDTTFQVTAEQYEAMTEEELANYNAAYEALVSDEEAIQAYNMVINLMLLMTSVGILAGIVVMEFVIPLVFKNGQTLGKKIFGLCLMRTDGVRMNNMQLFARTVLGKFAIETMIPVYILILLYMNAADIFSLLLLASVVIAQVVIVTVTRNNSLIHDLLAGTVVVDYASQKIFTSTQDLIEYQKRVAAERAARQKY